MKNIEIFGLIKKEKKNALKRMFRDDARIICNETKEMAQNYGTVLFSGIAANIIIPGISVPMPVNIAIGSALSAAVTYMHFKHAKLRIIMRRDEYKNDIRELDRLRTNIGMKMASDYTEGIVFSSHEKTLSSLFSEMVKNRTDISVIVKKNGITCFLPLTTPSEKLQPV